MWLLILILIFVHLITSIMSNVVNIAKFFMEKDENEKSVCQCKKHKLEE